MWKDTNKWSEKWQCQMCVEALGSRGWQPSNPNARDGSQNEIYRSQRDNKNFENKSSRYWRGCQDYFKNANGNSPNSYNKVPLVWVIFIHNYSESRITQEGTPSPTWRATQALSLLLGLTLPVRSFLWRHSWLLSWKMHRYEKESTTGKRDWTQVFPIHLFTMSTNGK